MKIFTAVNIALLSVLLPSLNYAQDQPVSPSIIIAGKYLGESPPLRDLPKLTDAGWQEMAAKADEKMLNMELESRSYPYAETALPKGPDPVRQDWKASSGGTRATLVNFNGENSPYYPPDANGTVGPNHYMQTINTVYSIYDKSGTLLAGPAALNTLFSGVPGSECNNGDPIVLFDEQADRWLVAEFSLCGTTDYMLVAVSTTNDPTGTWHKYSFDVDDMPDYEKFGIWQDGYYMGTNNSSGNDIYVFERSQMLLGLPAQGVGFNNPWRPTTNDGFMCVPPLDNDGPFAPEGSPGLFITINDDAIGGGSDQLWIYELDVNWATPGSSTFNRVQQVDVAPFDSNFGANWDNIKQLGTNQELDAIPQVIMNPPQYRNFASYETIVCCHTVDVDNTDHAGVRWYELRRASGGSWTIRQQGTYAPDGHSRWMGSIMLNGSNEIGLGYSISSTTMYPSIRYTGQTSAAYLAATGTMDFPELKIQDGTFYQSTYNRWGDYSAMQVDPVDDSTFWFTTEYIGSGGSRRTKIASFNLVPEVFTAEFQASDTMPGTNTTVIFTDESTANPIAWHWEISPDTYLFVAGTTDSTQNPRIQFTKPGLYDITLTVANSADTVSQTKAGYINGIDCSVSTLPFTEDFSDGELPPCWENIDHLGEGLVWQFDNPGGVTVNTTTSANGFAILNSDYYGSGSSQNADLVTPPLDLLNYTSVTMTFEHYFRSFAGSSGTFSYSIDGGNTWTALQTWTSTTTNPATYSQNLTTQVAGKVNVKFKWNYTGTWGYYWAVDDISLSGTKAGVWTGVTSTEWNNPGNWNNGAVPGSAINVRIPSAAPNWPVFNGNLTLGTSCKNIKVEDNGQLTVNGNLTVPFGFSCTFAGDGTIKVSGNWSNKGAFDPAEGTIEFKSPTSSNISGWTTSDMLIANYTRTTFPAGLVPLSGANSGPEGQNGYSDAAIGFSFNLAGVSYENVRISTNGWITLNQSGGATYNNSLIFSTSVPNTMIGPWFDYLLDDDTSSVLYKTSGTAPYRVFTVEWHRVLTYRTVSTSRITFQVKLFETTSIIEFHYGSLENEAHSNLESASIAIEDATGGSGHFIEGTTGSKTTGITTLKTPTNWPTGNIRFSPPPLHASFSNVKVNNPGGTLNSSVNTEVENSFIISPGGSFNVSTGKTLTVQGTVVE